MKIRVNVDAIGTTTDQHIEDKLAKAQLPICLGSMIPPIIKRQVMFDDLNFLVEKEAISQKEIAIEDVSEVIDADETYYKDKVLNNRAVEEIERYKNERADRYVSQFLKCIRCPLTEVCDKLTQNYLKVISIQEMIKLQDVLTSKNVQI